MALLERVYSFNDSVSKMTQKDKTIEALMTDAIKGSQVLPENDTSDMTTAELIAEMTALKKQIEKQRSVIVSLKKDAMSDPLTGIANRRVFDKELKKSIAIAKRYNRKNALLMVDLNKFKEINDEHGHVAGDNVLVFVAKLLLKNTRQSDVVARIGGDEFCVILNEISSPSDAEDRADKLTRMISTTPCSIGGGKEISVGVSIGYKVFNGDADPLSIIKHADSHMYAEKDMSHA